MNNEQILKLVNLFIDKVNRNDDISVEGLRTTDFPDKNIARLHNKLGNVKHYVSNEQSSFNGTDQVLSLKYAQQALKDASDELCTLQQRSVINLQVYNSLNDDIHHIDDVLNKTMIPEY